MAAKILFRIIGIILKCQIGVRSENLIWLSKSKIEPFSEVCLSFNLSQIRVKLTEIWYMVVKRTKKNIPVKFYFI